MEGFVLFSSRASFYVSQSSFEVELMTFVTKSGLEIYTPTKRDQCWDAPLLCAPYPDADLRLREKGNMRRGFMVDENYPAIGIHR